MLRHLVLLGLLFFTLMDAAFSQNCMEGHYLENIPTFNENQIASSKGVVYGNAINYSGQNQELILNLFYPDSIINEKRNNPLIVLMHGGSFLGGSLSSLDTMCLEFAKRGFVAATIEYRIGWSVATNCNGDTTSMGEAVYRALQDASAALRYLCFNCSMYHIDTTWIFVGGQSAGAFAMCNLAFATEDQLTMRYPYCQQLLGSISTSGNPLPVTYKIKGLFHNWGSLLSSAFVTAETAIPSILFAGELDAISPIDSGYYLGCTNYPMIWGSRYIYNKLVSLGVCAELTVDTSGRHGVYNSTLEQDLFRTERAVCFFQNVICNHCSSMYTTDSIPAECSTITIDKYSENISELLVSPNPFNNYIFLNNDNCDYKYSLLDNMGKPIWEGKEIEQKDFSYLPVGMYYLLIKNSNKTQSQKLIKL